MQRPEREDDGDTEAVPAGQDFEWLSVVSVVEYRDFIEVKGTLPRQWRIKWNMKWAMKLKLGWSCATTRRRVPPSVVAM